MGLSKRSQLQPYERASPYGDKLCNSDITIYLEHIYGVIAKISWQTFGISISFWSIKRHASFVFLIFTEKDTMDVWCNGKKMETAVCDHLQRLLFVILILI